MPEGKKRFYAVKRGRTPGVYTRWFGPKGAEEQVSGFAGALYRGFSTVGQAWEYMDRPAGITPCMPSAGGHDDPYGSSREAIKLPIHIYTDGGCIDNPGPGGYGVVIINGNERRELSGGYRLTTNNRMELMACIEALRSLKKGSHAVLYTDSQYVSNAVLKGWAKRWRSRNWMRNKDHRAINSDLWAELLRLLEGRDVVFNWVRGHAGNPENERCDFLAKRAAQGPDLSPDLGYEDERKALLASRLF